MDLNNLTVDLETLEKIVSIYNNDDTYYPIEIYIFLLNILYNNIDFNEIEKSKIKNLLEEGQGKIISDSSSIELLIYALDNNLITKDEAFIEMCRYSNLNLIKYILNISPEEEQRKIIQSSNNYALRWASGSSHKDVVKYFLNFFSHDLEEQKKMIRLRQAEPK